MAVSPGAILMRAAGRALFDPRGQPRAQLKVKNNAGSEPDIAGEGIMHDTGIVGSSPWYRSLDRAQWKALVASNLGWTFDGFAVFALVLTVGVAPRRLLSASQYPPIPAS